VFDFGLGGGDFLRALFGLFFDRCFILSGFETIFFGCSERLFFVAVKFFLFGFDFVAGASGGDVRAQLLAFGRFVLRFGDVGGESGGLFGGEVSVIFVVLFVLAEMLAVKGFVFSCRGSGGFGLLFAPGLGSSLWLRGSGTTESRDVFAGKRLEAG
jgi:hypothetical protein